MKTCATCQSPLLASMASCPHCRSVARSAAPSLPALAALMLGLSACDGGDNNDQALYGVAVVDADGDGYDSSEDCDDSDADVNPGATETPADTVDSNCDGEDDT